jgi:hypothetical protein
LFREGEERRRETENELQAKRNELDSELTFHPQVISPTNVRHPGGSDSVFQRLSVGSDRWEVRQKLDRIKNDLSKEWTFKPAISENSRKLVQREASGHDLYERQMNEVRRQHEELEKKKEIQTQEELREATFAPHIPTTSKSLAQKKLSTQSMDTTGGASDVYSRLTSPSGVQVEGQFGSTSNYNISPHDSLQQQQAKKGIILPEKVLNQVFTRLAVPHVPSNDDEHHDDEHKKVVPKQEIDQIFNRLSVTKTMSFTFKHDGGPHHHDIPHHDPHAPFQSTTAPAPPAAQTSSSTHPREMKQHKVSSQHIDKIAAVNPPPAPENQPKSRTSHPKSASKIPVSAKKEQQPGSSASSVTGEKEHHHNTHTPAKANPKASMRTPTPTKNTNATPVKKNTTGSYASAAAGSSSTTKREPPSTAKKTLMNNNTNIPSPPVMKGQGMHNQQSPMPPAPPSTIVKSSKPGVTATPGKQQADFIDDFTRKLEASLNLINQANNLTVVTNESEEHHSSTVTHEHHHSHQQHHQTTENHHQHTVNAAKQSTPNSTRKKKEGEEFINSIPVVEEASHSPMSP